MVILGPLFTQLGISLTIPLGMFATSFFDHVQFGWMYYLGTAFVFVSFIAVTMIQYKENQQKTKALQKKLKERRTEMYKMNKYKIREIEKNAY